MKKVTVIAEVGINQAGEHRIWTARKGLDPHIRHDGWHVLWSQGRHPGDDGWNSRARD